jgi:AcrR family transcriptional regulator
MSKAETAPRRKNAVGRPKNMATHAAIIEAARALLDEVGPSRLTIDGVAKRARVGKPTIYRSWANANELAMAALIAPVETDAGAPQNDFKALIENIIMRLNTKRGRFMALMLASAEPDGELFKAFANRVILKGRQDGLAILRAQMAAGEIKPNTDIPLVLDLIFGALMLRLLLRHEPLDVTLAHKALLLVLEGIRTPAR